METGCLSDEFNNTNGTIKVDQLIKKEFIPTVIIEREKLGKRIRQKT